MLTNSNERLTWKEIEERYPDSWVGLNDIKFENDDGANIETAIVSEIGTRDELYDGQFSRGVQMVTCTNPEKFVFSNWSLWLIMIACFSGFCGAYTIDDEAHTFTVDTRTENNNLRFRIRDNAGGFRILADIHE